MNGEALIKTMLVHVVGVALLVSPASGRIRGAGAPGARPAVAIALQSPQILVAATAGEFPPSARPGHECAPPQRLDRAAEPLFPIFGGDGPFAALPATPFSPVFCVRIGADGRVRTALLRASSGDPLADRALAGTLRRLSFRAARRDGHAVAAWLRVAVNRGAGQGWLIDPNPGNVRVEPVEMLVDRAPYLTL